MNRVWRRVLRTSLPLLALLASPWALAAGDEAPPSNARLVRADQLLQDDDPGKAAKEFEAAAQADPSLARAHEGAIRAWLVAGDTKKAVAAGQAASEKCPGNPTVLVALADALLASGSPVDAQAAVEPLFAGTAPPMHAWRIKAEAAAAIDPEGAVAGEKVLALALSKFPGNASLLEEMGDFLLSRERPADALPFLRKAIEASPVRVEPRLLLVRGLIRTKDLTGAREAASAAVEAAPGSPEARQMLGRTFEEAGEPAGALPPYQEAIRLRPRRVAFQVDLGFVLARMAKWKDAEKVLTGALKLDGDCLEARLHLGWVLNREGDLNGALDQYQAVLKRLPEDRRLLWNCADLCTILGKSKDARQYIERLLALEPKHSEAWRLTAQNAFRNGKNEDARKALAKCLELDPKNARALFLQGQIHDDEGGFDDAEKSYLAAAEADPKYAWPHLYLAELYDEALSKPVEALNSFRKYLALGGPDADGSIQKAVDALEKETGK